MRVRCCGWVPGVLAALIAVPAQAAEPCASLSSAEWLLGTWVATQGERTFTETWVRLSEATFEGKGVTTKGATAAVVDGESLRLAQMGQEVFYLSKVAHNALPVAFRLVQCSDQRLVFENPAHDFPRRIEYRADSAAQFTAHVSDGADKGFTLVYRRSGS